MLVSIFIRIGKNSMIFGEIVVKDLFCLVRGIVFSYGVSIMKKTNGEKKMTFEEVLPELKAGAKIIREGWSGFELYVTLVSGAEYADCPVTPYLLIKTSDEGFSSFAPTVCDILAADWKIVEA